MGENKEYVTQTEEKGSINISEDVISIIAAAALSEVNGVDGAPASLGNEFAGLLSKKSSTKGVKIQITDNTIIIDAYIIIRYGFVISEVAKEVQNAVSTAIESTTGLSVKEVNVHVSGVAFDKDK